MTPPAADRSDAEILALEAAVRVRAGARLLTAIGDDEWEQRSTDLALLGRLVAVAARFAALAEEITAS